MGKEHCFQLHNRLVLFFDSCYFMKKRKRMDRRMASHFCTYFNCSSASFTNLCFHLLKSSETDSREKYLQCRSACLHKWMKTWLFWQIKTPFPGFFIQASFGQYLPFLLEVQWCDTIYTGAGSGQTSTDFSSSTSLSSFCTCLSSCLSSSVPALPPL